MKKLLWLAMLNPLALLAMDTIKSEVILPSINRLAHKTVQKKSIKSVQKKFKHSKFPPTVKARMCINGKVCLVRGSAESLSQAKTLQAFVLMSPRTLSVFEKPKFSTSFRGF